MVELCPYPYFDTNLFFIISSPEVFILYNQYPYHYLNNLETMVEIPIMKTLLNQIKEKNLVKTVIHKLEENYFLTLLINHLFLDTFYSHSSKRNSKKSFFYLF